MRRQSTTYLRTNTNGPRYSKENSIISGHKLNIVIFYRRKQLAQKKSCYDQTFTWLLLGHNDSAVPHYGHQHLARGSLPIGIKNPY